MAQASYVLHCGSGFQVPGPEQWDVLPTTVACASIDPATASTSGPALAMTVDLVDPEALERIVIARVVGGAGYLASTHELYPDPHGNLSVCATVTFPEDGRAEGIVLVLPYLAFPRATPVQVQVELAAHDPSGPLVGIGRYTVELPADIENVPDLLTITAHALIALVRTGGSLMREEVRVIRQLLRENFNLDEVGDAALRRILKAAIRIEYTPAVLAGIAAAIVPEHAHTRFVNLLYAGAEAHEGIGDAEQAFIDELLGHLGIHDNRRYGDIGLMPHYAELELAPGTDFAEVRKAYRKLVRDYHPDRVQNLAKGFQEYANQKVASLNAAYAAIVAYWESQKGDASGE